ncbi:MAG: 3-isopropylmalate dehydratase small subunit [Flavobacteriaceae bacterium]|nr:3-isopropylmalate dehydratase small subunit [Flavobacteriaceae bacterium]MDG2499756.1 3-isopropylmalate dehydratase small subunit [Flavobacteriaceae bacterium]
MAYDKFEILKSTGVPLNIDNVDTDQIIPARFLKATERKGFGDNLFRDWRYNSDGTAIDSFPLNNHDYKGKILVAGKNFGCGSSREHAVWAIYDYGFRAVVSSFFADIFKNNCLNIGVLPIQVSESFLLEVFSQIDKDSESLFEVNLENQEFIIKELNKKEIFKISLYKKGNMSNGFDDIDYLLNKKEDISKFANKFIF